MTLPNTGGPEWSAAQATPWLSVNEALRYLDAFATRARVVDRDLAAPPGSCADGSVYQVDTSATGLWATHDGELAIAVGVNASNGWLFVDFEHEGNLIYVIDEDAEFVWDGAAWVPVGTTGSTPYRIGGFFTTTPGVSEVLFMHIFPVNVDFDDDFLGSVGDIDTNPTSSFVMDVSLNGSSVGTITISTGGAFSFVTSGAGLSATSGDVLKITGPSTPDASAAGAAFTLVGVLP